MALSLTLLCLQLFKSDEGMEFIQTAATFQFSVRSVDFSPDGDRLAAAGDDPTMSIITVDDAGESSVDNSAAIGPNSRGLAWDPAGTYVAVAQSSGALRLWDMSTKQEIWSDSLAPAVRHLMPFWLKMRDSQLVACNECMPAGGLVAESSDLFTCCCTFGHLLMHLP